jgi:phosphoribosyl-AMP cyclohydrolase
MDLPLLKYDEKGLIPAIIQDAETGEVLMMAYMNESSLRMTLDSGYTHFWSRSRQKYWKKGETSGNVQEVREVLFDCDADTLLIKVRQQGAGACHTGNRTCFYRRIQPRGKKEERGGN